MGFELNRFTKRVDKEYQCPICHLVFENAVESPHCQHLYCKQCIETWLKSNTECPIDKCALKPEELKPIPINLRNLLNKLEIKCEFELEGCKTVVGLENLENHVKNCSFDPNFLLYCTKQCGLQMSRREYQNHNCLTKLADIVKNLKEDNRKFRREVKDIKRKQIWLPFSDGIIVSKNNLIECVKDKSGYARSRFPLKGMYSYFEAKIVELGNESLSIGLSYYPTQSPVNIHENLEESNFKNLVLYGNAGKLYMYFNGVVSDELCGPVWNNGDIIGCGVKFTKNGGYAAIYFKRNNVLMSEMTKYMPTEQLYPTVFMNNRSGLKVIVY